MFPFIQKWIDSGYISPAQGRIMSLGLISAAGYVIGAAYDGEVFSARGLIQAFFIPVVEGIRKHLSDEQKKLESNG